MNAARKGKERAPGLTLFGAVPHFDGRAWVPFFKVGDRVRFLFDHATGTIVREFKGLTPADPTYVVRLDRPDEDGRIRTAWATIEAFGLWVKKFPDGAAVPKAARSKAPAKKAAAKLRGHDEKISGLRRRKER